jgi:hypothetical protein
VSGQETAREAAERNARAIKEGNITQVMADITPEALAEMMQMASAAGATGVPPPTTMPGIESYSIEQTGEGEDEASFDATFVSAAGTATVATRWKRIAGQWKIAGVRLVSAEPAGGAPGAGT